MLQSSSAMPGCSTARDRRSNWQQTIVCESSGGWVAVIDSAAMVSQTPGSLSHALDTCAFNFHVHDSDFWTYAFYRLGELVDQFTSMDESEYFGDVLGESDDQVVENDVGAMVSLDERWERLCDCFCQEASREAFDEVLTPADLLSLDDYALSSGEEGLAAFLDLLGTDPVLAHLSYRYWMESPSDQSLVQHCHLLYEQCDATGATSRGNRPTIDILGGALHSAASSDDIETIEKLVADGMDINGIPRGFTVTALTLAADSGSPETIRRLVSLGADLQKKGKEGASPLRFAVQSGSAANVSTLVELGADPHEYDSAFGSLLHAAVIVQSAEVVSCLLWHGVDRSLKNKDGLTPLEYVKTRRTAMEQALATIDSQQVPFLKECLDTLRELEQVLESNSGKG